MSTNCSLTECGCCTSLASGNRHASDTVGAPASRLGRRRALKLFTGLALGSQAWVARGADDLMLPQAIGTGSAARPSSGLGNSAQSSTDRLDNLSPGDGRSVAAVTVRQLDQLADNAARREGQIKSLRAKKEQEESTLVALMRDMEAKMAEYRNGLFCSGCGKTKSEILAKGEQFPHSGQSIVVPSRAQLEALERQLQGPIDQLRNELGQLSSQLDRYKAERDEALDQITIGLQFWKTGYSYQMTVLQLKLQGLERKHQAKSDEISKLLSTLDQQLFTAQQRLLQEKPGRTKDELQLKVVDIREDVKLWKSKLQEQQRAYQAAKANLDSAINDAKLRGAEDEGRLATAFNRPELAVVFSAVPRLSQLSPFAGLDELGVKYREGDFSPSRRDDVLRSVQSFVQRFRALNNVAIDSGISLNQTSAAPALSSPLLNLQQPGSPATRPAGGSAVPDRLLNLN